MRTLPAFLLSALRNMSRQTASSVGRRQLRHSEMTGAGAIHCTFTVSVYAPEPPAATVSRLLGPSDLAT